MTDAWRFYQRHANTWDRDRGKPGQGLMERRYLDQVISRLNPGADILDLGCGTGEPMARYLTESGFSVIGVDAAPSMIAICKDRYPNGTWIEADMRALALGRRFDAIIAWDSFFHLDQDEQRAMFPVFERHITTGGVLLFTSGPREDAHVGTMYGEDLLHASLAPDEYRSSARVRGIPRSAFRARRPQVRRPYNLARPTGRLGSCLSISEKPPPTTRSIARGFPDRFFERLFNDGIVRQGDRVLDLGTGTGTIARGLAKRGCVVTGLDPSDAMLEQAKALAAEEGVDIRLVQAGAEQTHLPGGSFDVVIAGTCWHWFDRPNAALEARRVLTPSGRLLIANLDWLPLPATWSTQPRSSSTRTTRRGMGMTARTSHPSGSPNLSSWLRRP